MRRTLPRDVASFTGRGAELKRLLGQLAGAVSGGVVGICAIGGMAGIGKPRRDGPVGVSALSLVRVLAGA